MNRSNKIKKLNENLLTNKYNNELAFSPPYELLLHPRRKIISDHKWNCFEETMYLAAFKGLQKFSFTAFQVDKYIYLKQIHNFPNNRLYKPGDENVLNFQIPLDQIFNLIEKYSLTVCHRGFKFADKVVEYRIVLQFPTLITNPSLYVQQIYYYMSKCRLYREYYDSKFLLKHGFMEAFDWLDQIEFQIQKNANECTTSFQIKKPGNPKHVRVDVWSIAKRMLDWRRIVYQLGTTAKTKNIVTISYHVQSKSTTNYREYNTINFNKLKIKNKPSIEEIKRVHDEDLSKIMDKLDTIDAAAHFTQSLKDVVFQMRKSTPGQNARNREHYINIINLGINDHKLKVFNFIQPNSPNREDVLDNINLNAEQL